MSGPTPHNNHPVEDQIPQDDMPSQENDTLFDALASEEPPLDEGDTNPSSTRPHPVAGGDDAGGLLMSAAMLILAVLMIIAAGLIFFMDEADVTSPAPTEAVRATATETDAPGTPTPTTTTAPAPTVIAQDVPSHDALPTAAADEQMLALLTPVPRNGADDVSGSIARLNLPFTEQIGRPQSTFVTYTVKQGDTLETIREQFGLGDICTLVWSNERGAVSPLRPGNEIIVPPVDGVYAKIRDMTSIARLAEQTSVDPLDIINSPYNPVLAEAQPDSLLVEGLRIMIPNGNGGDCNIWGAKPSLVSNGDGDGGSSAASNTGTYNLWGCTAQVQGGGFPALNPLGGVNYQFYQGFSPSHTGVDLSASPGTPIQAAGLGTVAYAGWNDYGYGRTVVIAHGTTFTLYAHLNSIAVQCGQQVNAGQVVGSVGNSGRSSGPHLHFEIRDANFQPLDPIYTIGF